MSLILPTIGFSLISASILALAAVGFTLQFGVTNILNLAFAEVMTSSAFVAYWLNSRGISIWICMVAAGIFGAIFSVLINRGLYRPFIRRGARLFALIIVSMGLALVIQNGVLAITGPGFFTYNQPQGLAFDIAGIRFSYTELAILLIAVTAMLCVHLLLTRTHSVRRCARVRRTRRWHGARASPPLASSIWRGCSPELWRALPA